MSTLAHRAFPERKDPLMPERQGNQQFLASFALNAKASRVKIRAGSKNRR
jgi:hypothetical protein